MKTLFRLAKICFPVLLLLPHIVFAEDELTRTKGGPGGATFLDHDGRVAGVRIRAGKYVDSIQLAYWKNDRRVWGPQHGGNGGKQYEIKFGKSERIKEIGGRAGKYVDAVYIRTNKKTYPIRGGNGGRSFKFVGEIKGVWGRSSNYLDALGVVRTIASSTASNNDLGGYMPSSGGGGGEKADGAPGVIFPERNTNSGGLKTWLTVHNRKLFEIIDVIAGSDAALRRYQSGENEYCSRNLFCEIAYREDAIAYATGSRK